MQQSVADDSLLFGTAERPAELFPDGHVDMNADVNMGSGSGSMQATYLEQAPPPPQQPVPNPLRASTGHWAEANIGVRNLDGSQTTDLGFGILNEQYTGNVQPASPADTTTYNRPAHSGSCEYVQQANAEVHRPSAMPGLYTGEHMGTASAPSAMPGTPVPVPSTLPGVAGNSTSFAGVYGSLPSSQPQTAPPFVDVAAEPIWNQPVRPSTAPHVTHPVPVAAPLAQPQPHSQVPPGLGSVQQNSMPTMGVQFGAGTANGQSTQFGNGWFVDAMRESTTPSMQRYGPPPAQQYSALQSPTVGTGNGTQMEQMLFALTQSTLATQESIRQMSNQPSQGPSQSTRRQVFKDLKPKGEVTKITGATEETLFEELYSFERDLNDLGIQDFSETAFYQLKNAVEGSAKDIIELALIDPNLGLKLMYQRALAMPDGSKFNRDGSAGPGYSRHSTFEELYSQLVRHLRLRSNLTDKKVRDMAAKYRRDAKMVRDTPEDAKLFLKQYRASLLRQERAHVRPNMKTIQNMAAQHCSPELQSLIAHEANNVEEEQMRDFLSRLQPAARWFIESQTRRPNSVTEMEALLMHWADISPARTAPAGRIQELTSVGAEHVPLAMPGMMSVPSAMPGTTPLDYPHYGDNEQNLVAALQRQSAYRHASSGGGKFQSRPVPYGQGRGQPCPHCKGHHSDLPNGACPTKGAAAKDAEFQQNPDGKLKLCHWMCDRKNRCNGQGHLARHHRAELEANGIRVTPAGKGGGKGGKGGRALGRTRNPGSSIRTRGHQRAIRAMIDGDVRWVTALDTGYGYDELFDDYEEAMPYLPTISTLAAEQPAEEEMAYF